MQERPLSDTGKDADRQAREKEGAHVVDEDVS